LIIAAKVAAISGKLVPAAIIVAQIAHSDIQSVVATYTADATIISDDITKSHMLAIILVMFNNIQFSCSLLLCFFLLNKDKENKNRITHINTTEYADNQNSILNQFSVFIFVIDKKKIHINKYMKFLISGNSIPFAFQTSSIGSFFIHKYQL
jgi:heme/copper-type cytochrome/quinol oxidase subunit 4